MLKVDVSGVTEAKREEAEETIRSYLSSFDDSKIDVYVIVASDFERTVDLYRSEEAKRLLGPYNRIHQNGTARAKTMTYFEQDGSLSFKLILAGDSFGTWDDSQIWDRLLVLLHESSHLLDFQCEVKNYGQDQLLKKKFTQTLEEKYALVSETTIGEYFAERYSLTVVTNAIKDGNPDAKIESEIYGSYADTLIDMLKNHANFFSETARQAKSGQIDSDTCLLQLGKRVEELLIFAAYVYGETDALEHYRYLVTKVESTSEFGTLLGTTWQSIVSKMRRMYETEGCPKPSDFEEVKAQIKKIYVQCGLRLVKQPDGSIYF